MKRVLVMLCTLLAAGLPHGARADAYDSVVREDTRIPNRYGALMQATLDFPASGGARAPGAFPVIMSYVPYCSYGSVVGQNKEFAKAGYVVAVVWWPGTCDSEGQFGLYTDTVNLSGYDAIEWLAAQPWSTGKVGMWGSSAYGISQPFVAQHRPPHLVTIVPTIAMTDLYEDSLYFGGMQLSEDAALFEAVVAGEMIEPHAQQRTCVLPGFVFSTALSWWRLPGSPEQETQCLRDEPGRPARVAYDVIPGERGGFDYWQHPAKDAYWAQWTARLDQIDVPVLSWGNWNDVFVRGNVNLYSRTATQNKLLVMGWAGHSRPGPGFEVVGEALRWFDYWLKGIDTGVAADLASRRFRYYVRGEQAWHEAAGYPVPGTRFVDLYATAGGALRTAPDSGSDTYAYDPTQGRAGGETFIAGSFFGISGTGGNDSIQAYNDPTSPMDQRLEAGGALSYVGEPLRTDVEVTGPLSATIEAETTAQDSDWVVRVVDVYPDGPYAGTGPQPGYQDRVTSCRLKGTHRDGHVHPQPIPAGERLTYSLECFPTSQMFRAGHRIGIQIASADTSHAMPNPVPALITIFHTSRVTLPVVRGEMGS